MAIYNLYQIEDSNVSNAFLLYHIRRTKDIKEVGEFDLNLADVDEGSTDNKIFYYEYIYDQNRFIKNTVKVNTLLKRLESEGYDGIYSKEDKVYVILNSNGMNKLGSKIKKAKAKDITIKPPKNYEFVGYTVTDSEIEGLVKPNLLDYKKYPDVMLELLFLHGDEKMKGIRNKAEKIDGGFEYYSRRNYDYYSKKESIIIDEVYHNLYKRNIGGIFYSEKPLLQYGSNVYEVYIPKNSNKIYAIIDDAGEISASIVFTKVPLFFRKVK